MYLSSPSSDLLQMLVLLLYLLPQLDLLGQETFVHLLHVLRQLALELQLLRLCCVLALPVDHVHGMHRFLTLAVLLSQCHVELIDSVKTKQVKDHKFLISLQEVKLCLQFAKAAHCKHPWILRGVKMEGDKSLLNSVYCLKIRQHAHRVIWDLFGMTGEQQQ